MLQLLVLPLGLLEIRLELIDLKLEIGCRCSTATTTFSSQPDFGSQILLQYSDPIAYTIDHPTVILHAVNQGHSIMLILATSKTSRELKDSCKGGLKGQKQLVFVRDGQRAYNGALGIGPSSTEDGGPSP
ncbi:hypothetical protein GW17_00045538 [Ensete ventricosum]|nr:hypothetical protein GW17_00045538 [Ensete ventricosum]